MSIDKEVKKFLSKEKKIKTGWKNQPSLEDLKQDLSDAKPARDTHVSNVDRWLDILNIEGDSKPKKREGRSSVQPNLVKKNNEWRYPSLTEPFLGTNDIFNVSPYTFEDKEAARQNALVLNNQFNTKLNKTSFIDEYVRTVVDEGTVFVRVGWDFTEEEELVTYPIFNLLPAENNEEVAQLKEAMMSDPSTLSKEWLDAIQVTQVYGTPTIPVEVGSEEVLEVKTLTNKPTVEVVSYKNLIIDPSCNGDLDKARFIIYTFETSKADLEATGLYSNLKDIVMEGTSILQASDSDFESNDESNMIFKDEPRKQMVANEYWGLWDINGDDKLVPIVATWIGDTLIRMELNPFPDQAIPFVSAQYSPVRKSLYGEPDSKLLEDNQRIMGATVRGMIDIMARSANAQVGIRQDMLDTANRIKFENGENYEFMPTTDPRQGIHMHTFNEVPNSAQFMLQLQQREAEELTGSRAFGPTATGNLTASATQSRGALDAASKREVAILRRLSDGIKKIGHKIISMNQEFLSDEEIIRVTNEDFIAIKREDLAGSFDLVLDISTAEEDNAKAQELSFMMQTIGPSVDAKIAFDIMGDIAALRKMPDVAKKLKSYEPPAPDPLAVANAEAELAKLQAEVENIKLETMKVQLEIKKLDSEVLLNNQKAGVEGAKIGNINADTDLKNLEYVEEELGVKHERELEKTGSQAKANLERDIANHAMKNESKSNAAVEDMLRRFNERTSQNNINQEQPNLGLENSNQKTTGDVLDNSNAVDSLLLQQGKEPETALLDTSLEVPTNDSEVLETSQEGQDLSGFENPNVTPQ